MKKALAMIEQGHPAPALDLPTDNGGRVSLTALKGKPAVVYFYPKDDTTGCTREAQDFTALAPDFAALAATVIGVSKDTVKKHDRFKAKYDLAVFLASDEDGAACEAWGVWVQKKLYGREYMGIERATFLVDADGRVARVWRNVKVAGHAAAALEAVKAL